MIGDNERDERPGRVSPKISKFLRKDYVSDGNAVMSISEYNMTHGTSFTLDDVYGQGYLASLSPEEVAGFTTFRGWASVEDDLPDDGCTGAARTLMKVLHEGGSVDDLHRMLASDVKLVLYGNRTIEGADNVCNYWFDYQKRAMMDGLALDLRVRKCGYDGHTALEVRPKGYAEMLVMFGFEGDCIRTMLFCPKMLQGRAVRYFDLDHEKFSREQVAKGLGQAIWSIYENCMPCLLCGEVSDNLEWHRFTYDAGPLSYEGRLSVCPHCGEMVEFYPEVLIRKGDEDCPF